MQRAEGAGKEEPAGQASDAASREQREVQAELTEVCVDELLELAVEAPRQLPYAAEALTRAGGRAARYGRLAGGWASGWLGRARYWSD